MVQALEPPRTNARATCTPCFPFKDVVREGLVQSNHPELRWKNSTRLAISAMMWFEKVQAPGTLSCNLSAREGTRRSGESALGSSALGYKGVTLVHDAYESARGDEGVPCYLCDNVVQEGSRRFDVLKPPRTSA